MVHDDTYIILDLPMLPVHSASMPQPPAPAATDPGMPRHALAQYIFNSLLLMFCYMLPIFIFDVVVNVVDHLPKDNKKLGAHDQHEDGQGK